MDEAIARDVELAAGGDADAFGRLVVEFQSMVVATAYGWLGDHQAALDASQEAFAQAHRRLGDLRDPRTFPGWLKRIVITRCDRVTRRAALRTVPLDDALAMSSDGAGPDETVTTDDECTRLRHAIEALEPDLRLVVALHHLAGMTHAAIAAYLELPSSTVDHRLRRARGLIRKELASMTEETIRDLRPDARFTATVQMFLAVRAGDRDRVRDLVASDPELLEVTEDWDLGLVEEGVAPPPAKGTPLIRAIERSDLEMVELLLDLGASPDGACGCATGETPLWTAVAFADVDAARLLLERGASTDVASTAGTTPLHVARMRGDDALADLLASHGADAERRDVGGRTAGDWAALPDRSPSPGSFETGIKAIDLFCPLDRGGATRVVSGYGVGLVVLLAEISARLAGRPSTEVVWCGFEQRPLDLADVRGALRETGLARRVPLLAAPRADGEVAQRDVFANTVEMARRRAEASGEDVVLIVLEEEGFGADVAAALPSLGAFERGSLTAVVAAPLTAAEEHVDRPYAGGIVFDRERAARSLWPAISYRSSSEASGPVAERARDSLSAHSEAGWPEGGARAAALHAYLTQPFVTAEPFTALPSTWVAREQTLTDVARICDGALDGIDPAAIAYAGPLERANIST